MPRPGVNITTTALAPASGVPTDTGTFFVSGLTTQGPVGTPVRINSLGQFVTVFGARNSYSFLYDALETFFKEGGTVAYVSRVVGPSAVKATVNLSDSTTTAIRLEVKNPGDYANTLRASVDIVSSKFRITITDSATSRTVEQSSYFASKAEALAYSWQTVNATSLTGTGTLVTATNVPFTGGADDRANVTDTQWVASLAVFNVNLGPGQVAIPGVATTAAQSALFQHAQAFNRYALADVPNTGVVSGFVTAINAVQAAVDGGYGLFVGPYVSIPGISGSTARQVPASALAAAFMARNDALRSPGLAVAGSDYPARFVIDVVNTFTDTDAQTAYDNAINLVRNVYGTLRLNSFKSATTSTSDPYWQANYGRLRMALVAQLNKAADSFLFDTLDGAGITVAAFKTALEGVLLTAYSQGALYGASAEEAFDVEVGPSVNTLDTISAGQLNASVRVKMSPHADYVVINIAKVTLTEAI